MDNRRQTIHYIIRAFLLGGFTYLIVKLAQNERLHYYIAPRTEVYVKLAAFGLFAIAVFQVYLALRAYEEKKLDCGCNHTPTPSFLKNVLTYGLFILPLSLGFFTQDTLLGSGITSLKGINLTSSTTMNQAQSQSLISNQVVVEDDSFIDVIQQPFVIESETKESEANPDASITTKELNKLFPSDKYTKDYAKLGMMLFQQEQFTVSEMGFIEIITTMDLYREAFVGKRLEMSGYVYREEDMNTNQFVVSRLAMSCCSADMEPYGLLANSPVAKELHNDTWVTVVATVALTEYNGMEIMELQVESYELIPPSDTPYVYPDYSNIELLMEAFEKK